MPLPRTRYRAAMTTADLSALLIDWGNQSLTKTERQQAHDAAARELAERNLASRSGPTSIVVNGMRYDLGDDQKVRCSME